MDVSNILASHAAKYQSVTVQKETPLEVDAGFLTVTDLNPIDEESYNENLEEHLQSLARDGVQTLFSSLFTLYARPSPDGPLAQLPLPTTQLPRAKPLPKPKPPTKWEAFAAAKGIQHKVRDKKVWDEEKQEWINRWGREGKNRQVEEQWITEVPLNADADYDPRKVARDARKERIAKNEKKHTQNVSRANTAANPRDARKKDIEKTLATTRISTASMGKFDKKLEGEKKIRGVKRKFDPAESSVANEAQASLALLSRIDSDARKTRREPQPEESVLNTRKAVRFASKGRGGLALGREAAGGRSSRGGSRGRGGGKGRR
ncbi:Ribosome biogenesis regulatory [Hypsizygus marmoreus]|uniref:Ribosome biogenesis regulatory protein n=1 Tax=Hypsizygus marmoreus TaxID=39966 RepID=A0A369JKD0_HYPMA|nr:Ribosome biogenesis regulatory [Hypsizygus marmoreus]